MCHNELKVEVDGLEGMDWIPSLVCGKPFTYKDYGKGGVYLTHYNMEVMTVMVHNATGFDTVTAMTKITS